MTHAYRYAVLGGLLLLACAIMVIDPVDAATTEDPDDISVEIEGIIEGQRLQEGQKVQLRGMATDTDGKVVENVNYLWYAGTTLIGQTQDIVWRVRGSKNTPIKLLVQDPDGHEAERVVNVTIRPNTEGDSLFLIETCYAFVLALAIIVTALALSFWYLLRDTPSVRRPPPHR